MAEFRALRPEDYGDVLELWKVVFGDGDAYFRAYLEGDPWHQDRYGQIAVAGGKIVSAVHVCRRPIRFGSEELTMGGIANVATLPEYRRQGLSSELLARCVRLMEEEGFDFSTLGTGIHRHYERHGWRRIVTPRFSLRLSAQEKPPVDDSGIETLSLEEWLRDAPSVYDRFNAGLPFHFARSPEYWNGWIRIRSRDWESNRTPLLGLQRDGALTGYLHGYLPEESGGEAGIVEAGATDSEALVRLAESMVRRAEEAGASRLSVRVPRIASLWERLGRFGSQETGTSSGTMLRGFRADEETIREIVRHNEEGNVTWWNADGF
jgi:predicted N-acetyltransferase YhbS